MQQLSNNSMRLKHPTDILVILVIGFIGIDFYNKIPKILSSSLGFSQNHHFLTVALFFSASSILALLNPTARLIDLVLLPRQPTTGLPNGRDSGLTRLAIRAQQKPASLCLIAPEIWGATACHHSSHRDPLGFHHTKTNG